MPSLDIRSCVVVFDASGRIAIAGHRRGTRWRIPSRPVGNLTITTAAVNAAREDLGVEIAAPAVGAALVTSAPSAITYAFRAVFTSLTDGTAATPFDVDAVRWVDPEVALSILDDESRAWLRYILADQDRGLILARRDASTEFAEVDYA